MKQTTSLSAWGAMWASVFMLLLAPQSAHSAEKTSSPREIALTVTKQGFEPSPIKVKKGEPLKLKVTRTTDRTCAKDLLIENSDVKAKLPLNETVDVLYTPTRTGQIKFGCAMNMMISGVLIVE